MLELILVMGLLAMAAALVAPSLTHFARGRSDYDAARQLLAVLQYARDQAMTQGLTYQLHVEPTSASYWLLRQQGAAFVRPADSWGRTFSLPPGMTLAWVSDSGSIPTSGTTTGSLAGTTAGTDAEDDAAALGRIQLDPDGGHDLATLRLTGPDGTVLDVTSDSPGETFRIVNPNTAGVAS